MGLRVIVTLIITFGGMYLALSKDAFYGLLTYAFWSYANPEEATWGLLPMKKLGFTVGVVVVLTTFLQKKNLFSNHPRNRLIILFWFICLFSALSVWDMGEPAVQFDYFSRVILITLIMSVLIDDKRKLHLYLWAIALFIGLICAQAGIKGALKGEIGGASHGYQGLIRGGRNYTAVFLCSTIPIVFYMMQAEKHKWLKPLLAFIFYGDILALVLTYSRGGFLGGITVGLYMLMIAKRKILACFFGFVLLASVVNYFIPQPYWERMETLKKPEGEEAYEGSAQARIMVWRSAIEMMKDYPLTGVGFYNSERKIGEYPDPVTGISQPGRAIHNSILKLGSELGFPALFLFIWIFGGSFITLMKIKRNVKRYEIDPSYSYYASMFQAALVGYYSAGLFVNAPFIDISWHLVGLSIALEQIVQREITWKYESTFIPQTKIAVH